MKKIIGFLICLFVLVLCAAASADVAIDEAHFPDAAFREYLKVFDANKNGSFSASEIKKITCLDVSDSGITDLTGLEYFPALTELYCYDNELTVLDLSANTKLTDLDCQNNELASLDLSKNTALAYLSCNDNRLTSLDLSKNTKLILLWCDVNDLTSLNLSKNRELSALHCSHNQLDQLDVSGNSVLSDLTCSGNQLTSLDLTKNLSLSGLICSDNQLTSLDLSRNIILYSLDCSRNRLASLEIRSDELGIMDCRGNSLSQLDVSGCKVLNQLVKETSPAVCDDGRYGWWTKYDWGVLEHGLFADETLQVVTDAGPYTSALGMTMNDFIARYNALPAPAGAPYAALNQPDKWTSYQDYQVAWFTPDSNSSVIILLLSKDKSAVQSTSAGLDMIHVLAKEPGDFDSLISVAVRCARFFAGEQEGYSLADYSTVDVVRYYYENGLRATGQTAQRSLNEDNSFYLSYTWYASTGEYYFRIFSRQDAR